MRKMSLKVEDLTVNTFVADGGEVESSTAYSYCACTFNLCQETQYCSNAPGWPNNTCYQGCETNQYGAC